MRLLVIGILILLISQTYSVCYTNNQCQKPTAPVCIHSTGLCGCIYDSDCGVRGICQSGSCSCSSDSDCSSGFRCGTGSLCTNINKCVTSNDCGNPRAPRCASGACGCLLSTDCPSTLPVCNIPVATCVGCVTNADCGVFFPGTNCVKGTCLAPSESTASSGSFISTGGSSSSGFKSTNTFYIDVLGSDLLGTGSINAPYQTIGKALSIIGGSTFADISSNYSHYYVVNVGPGTYSESLTIQTRPNILINLNNAFINGNVDWYVDLTLITVGPKLTFQASDDSHVVFDTGISGSIRIHSLNTSTLTIRPALELIHVGVIGSVIQLSNTTGGIYSLLLYIDTSVVGNIISSVAGNEIVLHAWSVDISNTTAIGGVSGSVSLYKLNGVKFINGITPRYAGTTSAGTWFNVEFNALQSNDFTGTTMQISGDQVSISQYLLAVPSANRGSVVATILDYPSGTTSNRPTGAPLGQIYFDTTLGQPIWWSGSAWIIFGAGGSLPTAATLRTYYVSVGGADGTGCGNYATPCLTIAAAMTSIGSSATSSNVIIVSVGPGTFATATVAKQYVYVIGSGADDITIHSGAFAVGTTGFTGTSEGGVMGIKFTGALNIQYPVGAATTSDYFITDCIFTSALTIVGGDTGSTNRFHIKRTVTNAGVVSLNALSGGVNVLTVNAYNLDVQSTGTLAFAVSGTTSTIIFNGYNGASAGTTTFAQPSGVTGAISLNLRSFVISGTIAGPTNGVIGLLTSVDSVKYLTTSTFTTVFGQPTAAMFINGASSLAFTPTFSANWYFPPVVTQQQANDQISSRINTLGLNMPVLNLGPASQFGILSGSTVAINTGQSLSSGSVGATTSVSAPVVTASGYDTYIGSSQIGASNSLANTPLGALTVTLNAIDALPCTVMAGATALSGTYTPGVYCFSGAVTTASAITLTGAGVYVFRTTTGNGIVFNAGTSFSGTGIAASNINNIFWRADTITAATGLTLFGNLVAGGFTTNTITLIGTTVLTGRVLSEGAVFIGIITMGLPIQTLISYFPSNPLIWASPPSNIQNALDQLAIKVGASNIIQVSSTSQFTNIATAMLSITAATPISRYVILVSPGSYDASLGGGIIIKPNVFIVGYGPEATTITAAQVITLAASTSSASDDRSGIYGVTLTNSVAASMSMSYSSTTGNVAKFYMQDVVVQAGTSAFAISFAGGATGQVLRIKDCTFIGAAALLVNGIGGGSQALPSVLIQGCRFSTGQVDIQSGALPTWVEIDDCSFAGILTHTVIGTGGANRITSYLNNVAFDNFFTVTGDATTPNSITINYYNELPQLLTQTNVGTSWDVTYTLMGNLYPIAVSNLISSTPTQNFAAPFVPSPGTQDANVGGVNFFPAGTYSIYMSVVSTTSGTLTNAIVTYVGPISATVGETKTIGAALVAGSATVASYSNVFVFVTTAPGLIQVSASAGGGAFDYRFVLTRLS